MNLAGIASMNGCHDRGTWSHVRHAIKRQLGVDLKWYYRTDKIPTEHDFFIFCDDGLDDIPMNCPRPNACYLIDTHLGWETRRAWAEYFDFVFCAQKSAALKMQADGLNAHWLPLACNPSAHLNIQELAALHQGLQEQLGHPDSAVQQMARESLQEVFAGRGLSKEWDIVFVGYMNEGVPGHPHSRNRVACLDKVFKAFPNSWLNVNCFHESMAARYAKGRVGFNVSILNDVNMRAFEIPSTGTAMLANMDMEGLDELGFVSMENFVGYEDVDDAIEKCRWMLSNPIRREEIAAAGHRLVRERHTYQHRMLDMFNICGLSLPNTKNKE